MKGYCINVNYSNIDNYTVCEPRIECGIFLKKEAAEAKVEELNFSIKIGCSKRKEAIAQEEKRNQQKWDVLNKAGLASGFRPQITPKTEWFPGEFGDNYYTFEEIDIIE